MQALVPTGREGKLVSLAGDVAEPAPQPDEVVIAVEAFSINRGETFLLEAPKTGWRPGKDVAGRVVGAAANGRGPGVGTRVVAHADHSGWAQRVAVSVEGVATLPEEVAFDVAAALPLAGLTALRLLRYAGPLASRRLLITGASGGVGHYLVEMAAQQGARVSVVTSSAERGARLLELGAVELVHDVADAHGTFDVVMESVGGEGLMEALRRVAADGLVVWFGQASRDRPALDFLDWDVPVGATLRRFGYQPSTITDATDLATLVRLVAADRLHPEIGLRQDWATTAEALEALIHRRVRGNAVLNLPSAAVAAPSEQESAA